MFISQKMLGAALDPTAVVVYLHCQRTGGSNLGRWLERNYKPEEVYSVGSTPQYVQWRDIKDTSVLKSKRLVHGFSCYKRHDVGRPCVFLGVVRHPAVRIISLMRLAKIKKTHFLHDLASETEEVFYRVGRERKLWYFDNLQTKRIANAYDADLALENIRESFALVCTTDELSAATSLLRDKMGWSTPPLERPPGPPDVQRYASRISAALMEEICANNQLDLRLYDFVKSTQEPAATPTPTL